MKKLRGNSRVYPVQRARETVYGEQSYVISREPPGIDPGRLGDQPGQLLDSLDYFQPLSLESILITTRSPSYHSDHNS